MQPTNSLFHIDGRMHVYIFLLLHLTFFHVEKRDKGEKSNKKITQDQHCVPGIKTNVQIYKMQISDT